MEKQWVLSVKHTILHMLDTVGIKVSDEKIRTPGVAYQKKPGNICQKQHQAEKIRDVKDKYMLRHIILVNTCHFRGLQVYTGAS
jgi:hypothetical protein